MLEPTQDLLLLDPQPLGRECVVGFGISVGAGLVHERDHLVVPGHAVAAVGEVLGGTRVEFVAGARREVVLEQVVVLQMPGVDRHDVPPRNPRNLRTARNRCTRTVDSLMPVMALTSRGEQSP